MLKKILHIYINIHSILSFSQNLVNNASFENYTSCPNASGQLTLAINWINPSSYGTPDYMNVCSSNIGVPYAGAGFQYARSGNAIVGIWAFSININDTREYVQTQLSNTLVSNNFYLVEYYLNRSNWSHFACNNISALLSNIPLTSSGSHGLINAIPQVVRFEKDFLIDTLNWIKIAGVYQAIGNENYITIGNFNNDAMTDYTLAPGLSTYDAAYYLIDDVSLTNITTPQWQYRDTTVYLGDSVLIGPAISGLNVDWFDMSSNFIKNAPGIYVKPTVNTSYQATETFNSAVYNHTVNVIVLDPVKVDEYNKLQNSVAIYPNPGANLFHVATFGITDGDIEVTVNDIAGKTIYEGKHSIFNALTAFVFDAKDGIYFVKLYNIKTNQTIVKKLVVQK